MIEDLPLVRHRKQFDCSSVSTHTHAQMLSIGFIRYPIPFHAFPLSFCFIFHFICRVRSAQLVISYPFFFSSSVYLLCVSLTNSYAYSKHRTLACEIRRSDTLTIGKPIMRAIVLRNRKRERSRERESEAGARERKKMVCRHMTPNYSRACRSTIQWRLCERACLCFPLSFSLLAFPFCALALRISR